jgi:hypothetical protein
MPLPNLFRRKPRVLTNLKIAEVSAVDKGAGEGCYIMLKKRASNDKAVANAVARLALSVKSIVDDDSVNKSMMLTKTFSQFQAHLDKVTHSLTIELVRF